VQPPAVLRSSEDAELLILIKVGAPTTDEYQLRTVDVTAVNPDELCPLSKDRSIASTSVSGDRDDAREDAGDGSGDNRLRAKQAAEEATCIARAR
uniref:Uncharacterized protein n=1 Tax=Oryza meridionalis TaxID=40149 RepID=A0A0E0CPS9_9ORYZ